MSSNHKLICLEDTVSDLQIRKEIKSGKNFVKDMNNNKFWAMNNKFVSRWLRIYCLLPLMEENTLRN